MKTRLIATLEDREGNLLPAVSQVDACAKAAKMGYAVAFYISKHNRYQQGEDAGRRELIQVAI